MDDAIPSEGFDAALTLTDPLDHLPANKRRELDRVLEIIFFEAERFRATKLSAKKSEAKILKVILYGSYARGDWMEDRLSGYRFDYDLLRLVRQPLEASPCYQRSIGITRDAEHGRPCRARVIAKPSSCRAGAAVTPSARAPITACLRPIRYRAVGGIELQSPHAI